MQESPGSRDTFQARAEGKEKGDLSPPCQCGLIFHYKEMSAFSLETSVNSLSLCPPKLCSLEVLEKFLYLWWTCIRIIPIKWFKTQTAGKAREFAVCTAPHSGSTI